MAILGVRSHEAMYFVSLPDGRELFVNENGTPIAPLLPGWRIDSLTDSFAPVLVLNLHHDAGGRATWLLDPDMNRIALNVQDLAGPMRSVLRDRAVVVMQELAGSVLSAPIPASNEKLDGLERVDTGAMSQIVDLAMNIVIGAMTIAELSPVSAALVDGGGAADMVGLKAADIRETLNGSITQDYIDLMSSGEMRCTAPDGNGTAVAQLGMILLDRLTAYRYVSPVIGAFYILTGDYHQTRSAIYIPSRSFFARMSDGPDARTVIAVMLLHVIQHRHRIQRNLALPLDDKKIPLNFVSDFPKIHIGHVVWNELGGLAELVACLPSRSLPDVMVINARNGSEPYGRIDVLFPEYSGKVRRPEISWDQAAAYVYDQNVFFMRYMTRFVRRTVGKRIMKHVDTDVRLDDDRQLAGRIGADKQPCVLLGLRAGNRTLRDQSGFLAAAIEYLLSKLGRITIVLEGTNSRLGYDPSTTYGGFRLPGGEEPVIEELRIVFALRERFRHHPIDIVSTSGCPLASSLYWIAQCRFFVAPWGAALSKYRWVCNLPGFVVTNKHNIGHPISDLPIYNDEEFNEAPTEMIFVALDDILDAPGPVGFYANFDVSLPALYNAIDKLIVLTAAKPTSVE